MNCAWGIDGIVIIFFVKSCPPVDISIRRQNHKGRLEVRPIRSWQTSLPIQTDVNPVRAAIHRNRSHARRVGRSLCATGPRQLVARVTHGIRPPDIVDPVFWQGPIVVPKRIQRVGAFAPKSILVLFPCMEFLKCERSQKTCGSRLLGFHDQATGHQS